MELGRNICEIFRSFSFAGGMYGWQHRQVGAEVRRQVNNQITSTITDQVTHQIEDPVWEQLWK